MLDIFWQFKRNSPPPATSEPVATPDSASPTQGFVTRDGWRFSLQGRPFFAAGTNLYSVACQRELWTEDTIMSTLNFHAQRGVTVLRIWCVAVCAQLLVVAHCSAYSTGHLRMAMASTSSGIDPTPFNPRYVVCAVWVARPFVITQPGVFVEANLQRLDFVLDYGAKVGLRFTLALTNSWPDFGGRLWYVRKLVGPDASEDEFFTNPATRAAYKQWVWCRRLPH